MSFGFLKELFSKNVLMTTAIAKQTCSVKYTAADILTYFFTETML